jgi:lysophosphatidate acyltransferase
MFSIFKVDITLENAKYLQIKEPYILINNHQSALDFLTMMKVWPGGNCSPLAKKELLYTGPFGIAIWLAGLTFIDRLNPQSSRGTLNDLAKRINKDNMRVWIYPEGSRSSRTELLPFKKGAFHLAIQAQIPIVCMVTSSYANFFSIKERKYDFNGQVKVRVLPPFQTKGMTPDSVNQLTKHLQDTMQREFDTLNKEINLGAEYYTSKKQESPQSPQSPEISNLNDDSIDLTQNDDNNNSIIDSPPSPEKKDLKKFN